MEKATKAVFVYWTPVAIWMAIIFFLSSRASITVSPEYWLNFLFFKTLHVIEYAILFILLVRATRSYTAAFVLTLLYATTDEFHQQFVPSREGRVRDVIIDGIGAGLVWYYLVKQLPKAPQRLKKWARSWDVPF
jgi:VanZ family protein